MTDATALPQPIIARSLVPKMQLGQGHSFPLSSNFRLPPVRPMRLASTR